MNETIINMLIELLVAVITVCVPIITKYAIGMISNAAAEAKANTDDVLIRRYIEEIESAVSAAVTATNQTFVDELKKKNLFNNEEAWKEAFEKAMATAKELISSDAKKFIEEIYGDLPAYLTPKIEAAVKEKKAESAAE